MMSSSLPTRDGQCGDDQEGFEEAKDCYVVRLTPFDRYSFEEAQEILENELIEKWVISKEILPHIHFHIVVKAVPRTHQKLVKQIFKDFVYSFWPERKRGFGNAQYNFQVCEDEAKAISYALKEKKESNFSGYTEEYIQQRTDESFLKQDSYKVEYTALCKEYLVKMDDVTFKQRMILLRAKYGLKVSMNDINGYLLSNKVLKDPDYALFLAKQ